MDREKYPNYFLAVLVLYSIVLIVGLGYFILPSLEFAAGYIDFYIITALFILPLIMFAVYEKIGSFEFLWKKESLLRTLMTVLVIIDFAIDLYLMILLI